MGESCKGQCLPEEYGRLRSYERGIWKGIVALVFRMWGKLYSVQQLLPSPKPARTCIQAARLPNDVDVEIEAIATT